MKVGDLRRFLRENSIGDDIEIVVPARDHGFEYARVREALASVEGHGPKPRLGEPDPSDTETKSIWVLVIE